MNQSYAITKTLVLSTQSYFGDTVTYHWYEGQAPTGILLGSTVIPALGLSGLSNGVHAYYVIVEVDACFSNPSSSEIVNVIDAPDAETNDSLIQICEGESIVLGTPITGTGLEYLWTGPNGYVEKCSESCTNKQRDLARSRGFIDWLFQEILVIPRWQQLWWKFLKHRTSQL